MSMNSPGSYSDPGGYENWRDIEKGSLGGGRGAGNVCGIILIVVGVLLAAVFPPLGILIWIGVKMAS